MPTIPAKVPIVKPFAFAELSGIIGIKQFANDAKFNSKKQLFEK